MHIRRIRNKVQLELCHDNNITYKKAALFNTALHQASQSQLYRSLQREGVRHLTTYDNTRQIKIHIDIKK